MAATGGNKAVVAGQAVIDATPTTGTANQKAVAQAINDAIVAAGTTAGVGAGVNSADDTTRNAAIDAAIHGFYDPLGPGFVINYTLLVNTASELLKLAGGVKKTLAVEIRDAVDPTIVYMPSTQILTWEIL